jgi:hypothetical protein
MAGTRLLAVPAIGEVKARLGSALAHRHCLAGACCFDSSADDAALYHCSCAMQIGAEAGDGYRVAYALWQAGFLFLERGHPNDALKCFQLGQIRLMNLFSVKNIVDDPRAPVLSAKLAAMEAWAYADLEQPNSARRELTKARDGWAPPDRFEQADMDYVTARVALRLDRMDVAESFAAASVRRWGESERIHAVQAGILLATIHVLAGDSDGLTLAHAAIGGVASLKSGLARDRLAPLQLALAERHDGDSRELARAAREVAAAGASRTTSGQQ